LAFQILTDRAGQHHHPVLVPFATPDHDLPARQLDVFDTQLAALPQAQTAAIEQPGHQAKGSLIPFDALQHRGHFLG
jgi:hypothetical protein